MLGAIAGDIIGSPYEWNNIKTKDFELFDPSSLKLGFTDDSVLTVALMDAIINNKPYGPTMQHYFRKYPDAGYGSNFYSCAPIRKLILMVVGVMVQQCALVLWRMHLTQ